jgi:hypothetical protein
MNQMGRQPGEHQLTFAQRLANQPEIEQLEIAQTAVNKLARPRRRSAPDVPRVDQGRAKTAAYASSATPEPVIPPPTTSTSNRS